MGGPLEARFAKAGEQTSTFFENVATEAAPLPLKWSQGEACHVHLTTGKGEGVLCLYFEKWQSWFLVLEVLQPY